MKVLIIGSIGHGLHAAIVNRIAREIQHTLTLEEAYAKGFNESIAMIPIEPIDMFIPTMISPIRLKSKPVYSRPRNTGIPKNRPIKLVHLNRKILK